MLEPFAGKGIWRLSPRPLRETHITCMELYHDRAERLRSLAGLADDVVESTIKDYLTTVTFSALDGVRCRE